MDGVKCRKFFYFFVGLLSIMCLIVRKFLAGAPRLVVGALHSSAPLGYGTSVSLEVGTESWNILIFLNMAQHPTRTQVASS